MFEFLLIVVGVIGIAISVFSKIAFARRGTASVTEGCGEQAECTNARLFAKPGRGDPRERHD